MKDQDVAVAVLDEAHVADACVLDADDVGAPRARLLHRRRNVGHAKGDARFDRHEGLAVALRIPEAESHVRRLDLAFEVLALGQAEHVAVEGDSPRDIAGRDGDKVDLLDLHYGSDPSEYGA